MKRFKINFNVKNRNLTFLISAFNETEAVQILRRQFYFDYLLLGNPKDVDIITIEEIQD